jgi:acyl-CoA synthetase (AMP-forming)/AMP-acid ligase II
MGGAGVEPTLHAPFEARFGFPLVEVWGMTDMSCLPADCHEPRRVHSRAMGRPQPGLEVRVVEAEGRDAPRGEPGEALVRHSAETPDRSAFSGYSINPRQPQRPGAAAGSIPETSSPGMTAACSFRRSQEEHHPAVGREYCGSGDRSLPAGPC